VGRFVISLILIFDLTRLTNFIGEVPGIAQLCNSRFGDDSGLRSFGEKARL